MKQVVRVSDWEQEEEEEEDEEEEEEDQKKKASSSSSGFWLIWMATLSMGLVGLLITYYMYLQTTPPRTINISASENLLFGLIFIAVALFYVGKKRHVLERSKSLINTWCCNYYYYNRPHKSSLSLSVHWYIGDEDEARRRRQLRGGEATAAAICVYSNGHLYEGEFHRGKSNGSGVYNYFVNGNYKGDWVDGKYDGYGIETWARGSRYRGQYSCGLRHGFGIYTFYTGDPYAGQWFHGQYHGLGLQTCSDASSYLGYFNFGLKHGLGSYHFGNGDRYAGEYFGDKIHGFGVYRHLANGHCYEGSWHEGPKQGFGMYTFCNGEAKCGEWDPGSLKAPLPSLTHSVLRPVQAARKAAEDAINLGRVDDQVNKAVIAANRAATAARVAAVKAVQNRMDAKLYDTSYV